MSQQPIDANMMTLSRFLAEGKRRCPHEESEDLAQLLTSIQIAIKAISAAVRQAGIAQLFGAAGETNVQGEEQKKLDVLSNDLFINELKASGTTCLMVSEENESVIEVETARHAKYIVTFDPLDGSSNIDCLVSIGSIFGIFRKPEGVTDPTQMALQKGRDMVAAGYGLFGSTSMLVIGFARSKKVNGFMLDSNIGEFVLTDPDMKIPTKGKIYSVNEGYYYKWSDDGVRKYIESKKNGPKPYSARYIGSMVADVHRTIKYGGIFLYPRTTDAPKGKLRLLYEGAPMAFLIELAGGSATDGQQPVLDIVPSGIHVRAPVFMGSTSDVDELLSMI